MAYRGRAVAGVMGLPFYDDSLAVPAEVASQACGRVLYGIAGTGLRLHCNAVLGSFRFILGLEALMSPILGLNRFSLVIGSN